MRDDGGSHAKAGLPQEVRLCRFTAGGQPHRTKGVCERPLTPRTRSHYFSAAGAVRRDCSIESYQGKQRRLLSRQNEATAQAAANAARIEALAFKQNQLFRELGAALRRSPQVEESLAAEIDAAKLISKKSSRVVSAVASLAASGDPNLSRAWRCVKPTKPWRRARGSRHTVGKWRRRFRR